MTTRSAERPPTGFLMVLGAMAAVPAMTMDLYLPSLPDMMRDLDTTQALAQGTISGMMIGSAVGQLISGPLSDRFGRKRPFYAGLTLHVLMSLLLAFSPNIVMMIGIRMLQGVGNAAAMVAAYATLRDRYSGPAGSAGLSRIQMVIAIAPLIAPSIGGFIAHHWGWRAVFVSLALMGIALMVLVHVALEESHPPERRATELRMFRSYLPLLKDPTFLAYAIIPAMATTVLYTYLSAASFVLQDGYGLSAEQFVIAFGANGIMIVLGAQLNSALVYRVGARRMLLVGLAGSLLFAGVLLATALTEAGGLWGFVIPLGLLLTFNFIVMPNGVTLALARHGERAGGAAAVVGAVQQMLGGLISPVVALLGGRAPGTAIVLLFSVVVAAVMTAIVLRLERRA